MNLWTFEPVVTEGGGPFDGPTVEIQLAGVVVWTDTDPSRGRSSNFLPDVEYSMRQFAERLAEALA